MRSIKFLTLIITVCFILIAAMTSFAAEGVIYFSDPATEAGDEVVVTMRVQADGSSLSDANITLKYPADSMEFISGTDSDGGAGTVRVHGTSDGGGTGMLKYDLKFRTLKAGSFTVNLDTYEVYDSAGQIVSITHAGSSVITASPDAAAASDASLSTLEISPGTLEPGFSPDIFNYSVMVGLNVESLTINAMPSDSAAKVNVAGNKLSEGENDVVISVISTGGGTEAEYHINVVKAEGGAENIQASSEAETTAPVTLSDGVQLMSKGKTITVVSPDEGLSIPEGFRESIISIDKQKVSGWVWGADETPQYCVVYGMNDQGEMNLYRYDMSEKTIQRYFEDPMASDCIALSEYESLAKEKDELQDISDNRFLIMCIAGIVCGLLFILSVYLLIRFNSLKRQFNEDHSQASFRDYENDDLSHDYEVRNENDEYDDDTRVISRNERRRRSGKRAPDETAVIGRRSGSITKEDDSGFEDIEF